MQKSPEQFGRGNDDASKGSEVTGQVPAAESSTAESEKEKAEEKRYRVVEHKGEKIIFFEVLYPTPTSVAEVVRIVAGEFPGVSLDDLEITAGDETFTVAKKEQREKSG